MQTVTSKNEPWKVILATGLCGCCDDGCGPCCCALFCRPCVFGSNMSKIGRSCIINCCCYPLCCGCGSNDIEEVLLGHGSGCCIMCCLHIFCGCCQVAKEARALKSWELAGKPAAAAVSM